MDSSNDIASRSRRTRLLALGLLCVTVAVALVLARLYHSGSAAILVSALGGMPSFYLSVAAYRDDRKAEVRGRQLGPAEMADRLAVAVHGQWLEEAAVRRLNDPYPLPVRWVASAQSFVDQWSTLTTLASSGAGWPEPTGMWASGPDQLSGEGSQLADVLARVPTGRLVVLGGPGAGKTILMMRLVLDLLARRDSGGQVPVLLSAGSWDPSAQDLRDWLADELTITYTALLTRAEPAAPNRVRVLLDEGLILPILDGLDEIADAARGHAIGRINDAARAGERFVVTCRRESFESAVRPADGSSVTLRGAAGVELCPLDDSVITSYLCPDGASPDDMLRWQPLLACVKTGGPVARVLSNPLMLSLTRTIYNPRPGDLAGSVPDPAELCRLPDDAGIEARLLGAFVTAAYRDFVKAPGRPPTWAAARTRRWLGFLARHLERTIHAPDLAWWQLAKATPPAVTGLATGLVTGLIAAFVIGTGFLVLFAVLDLFGMYWWAIPTLGQAAHAGLRFALIGGLAACAVTSVAVAVAARYDQREGRGTRPSRPGRAYTTSVTAGLMVGAATWNWYQHWMAAALGCASAVLASLAVYLARRRGRTPDFRRSWTPAITVGTVTGLTFGISVGVLGQRFTYGLLWGPTWGIAAGLAAGIGVMLKGVNIARPAQGIRWSPRKGVPAAVLAGVAAGFVGMLTGASLFGFSFALIFGISIGLAAGAVTGLERISDDLTVNANPAATLERDRNATVVLTLVTGITAGLAVAVTAGSIYAAGAPYPAQNFLAFGLAMGTSTGISVALVFGFVVNGFGSAWPGWLIARAWLTLCRRLPVHLAAFLDDAHKRGVLRRVGAVYQFRHIELQRQLARETISDTNSVIATQLQALKTVWKQLPRLLR